ncbi:MFS transporter [Pseudohoeflea suaedae]|uniref:MFS transporter n=1 Tax=Pseudohoeflea suaedae TaxID=877384 RepID=A0A4R5PP56_9HYPH|nr:MFS transporter [Pseudohoeflea suaedae]TDH38431.1 MFS transporter [Pseudohoeflea suaedae]
MKSFSRFFIAAFVSSIGSQITLFAAPLLVYHHTGSLSYAGLSYAIEQGIGALSLPLGGVMADRVGATRLYIIADIARFLICILCFLLMISFPDDIFLVVSVCAGALCFCLNLAYVALESAVPKYIPQADLHKAQSMLQSIEQLSLLVGPVAAAGLVAMIGGEQLYIVAAGTFLVSLACMLLSGRIGELSAMTHEASPLADLVTGARTLFRNTDLILLCLFTTFNNIVYCSLLSVGAATVAGTFGLADAYYGALIFTAGFFTLLVMMLVPALKRRLSMSGIGILSVLGIASGGLMVALSTQFWMFFIGFALVVAADALTSVYLRTERVRHIPSEHLGKTLGLMVMITALSYPLAGLIVGIFTDLIGFNALILALSTLCLTGNVLVMRALSSRAMLPAGPETSSARV